jgi:hypothetical protein
VASSWIEITTPLSTSFPEPWDCTAFPLRGIEAPPFRAGEQSQSLLDSRVRGKDDPPDLVHAIGLFACVTSVLNVS